MMLVRGGLVAAALAAEGAVRAPRAPPTLLAAAQLAPATCASVGRP